MERLRIEFNPKKSLKEQIRKLEGKKAKLNIKIGELIKPYVPDNVKNVSTGLVYEWYRVSTFWDCEKSPIGCCMYNHNEDRFHDSCLFCGDPEERK